MAQYPTCPTELRCSIVITTGVRIMSYILLSPCGVDTEIDVENNDMRNQQKIDILSPNLAINERDSCEVWSSYGFELFEYLILRFLMITLVYWGLKNTFNKNGFLTHMRKRKQESKSRKQKKMIEILQKQGIMILETKEINIKE